MQVVGPLKQENWEKLKTVSYEWYKSQPESIEAHNNFALALYKLGNTKRSEEEFKKIAKKNPNFVQSFLYLYEIAKLRENKQDIAKYKSIVFSLDETIVIE
jgi:tetratricopeptide (TPR) repeat protein